MKENQFDYVGYMGSIIGCYQAMPQSERDELHNWEKKYVTGSGDYVTSDWPGWEKYIGKRPELKKDNIDPSGHVYLMKCGENNYKIGIAKNINNRLLQLQTGNPLNIELIHSFFSKNARSSESRLHQRYAEFKIRNEWFYLMDKHIDEISRISEE